MAEDTTASLKEARLKQPTRAKHVPQRPLSDRLVRVMLLLSSYLDACEAPQAEATESLVGTGSHENSSREPLRNVSPPERLWYAGSYRELERGLDALRLFCIPTYNATWARHVIGKRDEKTATKAALGVEWLSGRMPRSIYVPTEISENAGYLYSEAKEYARPRKRAA